MEPFLLVIILLCFSAFFSSAELWIIGVPLYKIKKYLNEFPTSRNALMLLRLRTKSERTLIAILIWNNLVNVALSIYAAQLWEWLLAWLALYGAVWFIVISFSITFLILFFGEIIPKVFATKFALLYALQVAPLIQRVIYLFYPFVYLLEIVILSMNKILWNTEEKVSRDDIEIFVEEWLKQGIFNSTESLIVHNFLEFRERAVESVLQHRTNLFALDQEMTLADAAEEIHKHYYSRIPLYQWDKDHIVWLLTMREAFKIYLHPENHSKKLKEFWLNTVVKVPITASIFDVFMDMKKNWWHFAVVIDEYGGTAWIVTFEDILEDLVWAIKDESDLHEEWEIIKESEWSIRVKWDVPLRDVLDTLQVKWRKFPDHLDDYLSEEETVSYIILHILKDFAKQGDIVSLGSVTLKVIKVNKLWDKIMSVRAVYEKPDLL